MDNFTAEQLMAMASDGSYVAMAINLAAFATGLGVNVYTKMKSEDVSFGEYWKLHGKHSLASVGTLVTVFAGLQFAGDAPLYAYFSAAYMSDSLINKVPKKVEAAPSE